MGRSGKADERKPGRDAGSKEAMEVLRHKLIGLLVIGLCSIMTRVEGFDEMEEMGRDREGWFRQFLEHLRGIPEEGSFRRLFERLNPVELMKCPQNIVRNSRVKRFKQRIRAFHRAHRKLLCFFLLTSRKNSFIIAIILYLLGVD
ncbi:MAG: transposase family protein [Treponema sp.]|jgi:hypothetical protein|nr:transposase family protein [Treponema sp.]